MQHAAGKSVQVGDLRDGWFLIGARGHDYFVDGGCFVTQVQNPVGAVMLDGLDAGVEADVRP